MRVMATRFGVNLPSVFHGLPYANLSGVAAALKLESRLTPADAGRRAGGSAASH